MTSGLETEWDYSGRNGRNGQEKKISKANERKGKVKRGKNEEVNGQGGKRGTPAPHVTTYYTVSVRISHPCQNEPILTSYTTKTTPHFSALRALSSPVVCGWLSK